VTTTSGAGNGRHCIIGNDEQRGAIGKIAQDVGGCEALPCSVPNKQVHAAGEICVIVALPLSSVATTPPVKFGTAAWQFVLAEAD
jgi:hypothetical protein